MQANGLRWICFAVGYVFITSGVLKLLVADFKGLFASLGLPFPEVTLYVVAVVELVCGMLIVAGMFLKQAVLPLLCIMIGAIVITKIPVISGEGFLAFAFDARLDIVMIILLGIIWKSAPRRVAYQQ